MSEHMINTIESYYIIHVHVCFGYDYIKRKILSYLYSQSKSTQHQKNHERVVVNLTSSRLISKAQKLIELTVSQF